MTEQKAKDILENECCYECSYGSSFGASECKCTDCEVAVATRLAIKALEKQIAKKPKEIDEDLNTFVCPLCNKRLFTLDNITTHKHCLICGQKLDWEGGVDNG